MVTRLITRLRRFWCGIARSHAAAMLSFTPGGGVRLVCPDCGWTSPGVQTEKSQTAQTRAQTPSARERTR